MKYCVMEKVGGPEVLKWEDMPTPSPLGNEVLIRVKAAAINLGSVKYRRGDVGAHAKFPSGYGVEVAGVVEAVGPDARRHQVGSRVFGRPLQLDGQPGHEVTASMIESPEIVQRLGAVAEFTLSSENEVFQIPPELSFAEAAAAVLGVQLAWHGLYTRQRVTAEEDVFVLPSSGNVGLAAAQIAKLLGRRVIGATGSDAKVEAVSKLLDLDLVLNYNETKDLGSAVREVTDGVGVQVAWDGVGGPTFNRSLATLAPGGKIILYAANYLADKQVTFGINSITRKRLSIVGNTSMDSHRRSTISTYERMVIPWLASRKLVVPVSFEFPLSLEGVHEAEETLDKHEHIGRVVLLAED
jgi:NADPH:quinone reductase-like Zn-dependent oxidoreductase